MISNNKMKREKKKNFSASAVDLGHGKSPFVEHTTSE
jgi:hypothetical protein